MGNFLTVLTQMFNESVQIACGGNTDVGCVRKNNEDAFLIREDLNLFVVADGVGGAAAGEVASELFVLSCEEEFEKSKTEDEPETLLTECFKIGNQKIRDHMVENPDTQGMGCTAEVITFNKGRYHIGHVGDSRSYLIRDGRISQITKDHSYLQEQIDLGLITPEDSENHWMKNTIYKAVGSEENLEADVLTGRFKDGDIYLLCSDGLSDFVALETISELAQEDEPVQDRVEKLIEAAKERGGKDNITVLICQVRQKGLMYRMRKWFGEAESEAN